MMTRVAAAVCLVFAGAFTAGEAHAQMIEWKDRGFVNVSGGAQGGAKDVSSSLSQTLYDETLTLTASRTVDGGPFWDATAGVRVWKNMAVAVSVSGRSANSAAATTASVPHPVFYEQPRTVSGTVADMKHREMWTGVLAAWMFPVTTKFEVLAMAGPAVVNVQHELVQGVTIVEGTPPTVTATLSESSKSVWGVTAGVDARYLVTSRIGVGAFARYQSATANLTPDIKLKVGGLQFGGGIRIRF